ncbi:MAG: glycoside hydrolase family 28 protein [Planctomycetota bacterium]|jgi:polygalacturonase
MSTPTTHDITAYGAVADGTTLNTDAIQKAIDTCHEAGGGRVHCGPGHFLVGSLELKSHVELHLAAGCRLVGSTELTDYVQLKASGFNDLASPEMCAKSIIRAVDAEDIAITGSGTIDGQGPAWYDTEQMSGAFYRKPSQERPRMVILYRCRNVRFEDSSFLDCPCWTFWLMKCERVNVHRIRILADQRMINNDGIDIDACRDVTVSDSFFQTGDDCIILRAIRQVFDEPGVCENITVTNCTLNTWCQGIRVGCPNDSLIRNVAFSNLTIQSRWNGIFFENPLCYLKDAAIGTADVHDIVFTNITIDCGNIPIGLVVEEGVELIRLSDISFSNIRARSGAPCQVVGSSQTTIRDIQFSDVIVSTAGESAILCRHSERVRLTNVELTHSDVSPVATRSLTE